MLSSSYQSEVHAAFAPEGDREGPLGRRSRGFVQGLAYADMNGLGTRTVEVLLCAREGDTNAQISRYLEISVSTVKYHIAKILRR